MRAAVGFSVHTGWAAAVVLSESGEVLDRVRLEMADADHDSRFVFHAAAEHAREAERRIANAERTARSRAEAALAGLRGRRPIALAALAPSRRALPGLPAILASHALVHAAEGALYRTALASACEALGLTVVAPRPLEPPVGKMKPPWGKDQKIAAALAWGALRRG
jgi:hypothetical protein